jgi:hypothetical protein
VGASVGTDADVDVDMGMDTFTDGLWIMECGLCGCSVPVHMYACRCVEEI